MLSAQDTYLLDDPKYRQYINAIDKALKSFESSSEWADLIAALGKLNKVLNPKYKVIPKKVTVGKRLAQCMHPALPGGVHLKALQVYDTIFNIIKRKRLQHELYVFSTGIFPLFANTSMQVRPVLLNLYETHILPLGGSLNVCVDGLLMGLLPGLEDGMEYFERVDEFLVKLALQVGQAEFFSAIWRCVLIASTTRLAALQLVLRRFNKKQSTEDQLHLLGSDINVMVLALCEALQDSSVLIQRSAFDVLILVCPLSVSPFPKEDCCTLLVSAVQCLLRRDMSLNRRLYSWLLGQDQSKGHDSATNLEQEMKTYFENHSKGFLIKSCKLILLQQKQHISSSWSHSDFVISDDLFPLKLLVSLLDKTEIGPVIIDQLLLDVFRLLRSAVSVLGDVESDADRKNRLGEMSKASSLLLDLFDPSYIWEHLIQLFNSSAEHDTRFAEDDDASSTTFSEICGFVEMFLRLINVENFVELKTHRLPNVLHCVLKIMAEDVSASQRLDGLNVCINLLDMCQPNQLSPVVKQNAEKSISPNGKPHSPDQSSEGHFHSVADCLETFLQFFSKLIDAQLTIDRPSLLRSPISSEAFSTDVFYDAKRNPQTSDEQDVGSEEGKRLLPVFHTACRLLLNFACFPVYCQAKHFVPATSNLQNVGFPNWLNDLLGVACQTGDSKFVDFQFVSCALTAILDLLSLAASLSRDPDTPDDNKSFGTVSVRVLSPMTSHHAETICRETKFFEQVTLQLWQLLGNDSASEHHLTCVHLITRLHTMCADARCEDVILVELLHECEDIKTRALAKFCRFWHLTRILASKRSTSGGNVHSRGFNRCLFALVDCLTPSPAPPFQASDCGRAVAMTTVDAWLRECLERQDLLRVLEPFLAVLLNPNTRSAPLPHPDATNQSGSEDPAKNSDDSVTFADDDSPIRDLSRAVICDITEGRQKYKELMSELTTDGASEQDRYLAVANKIVTTAIRDAVRQLNTSTSQHGREDSSGSDDDDDGESPQSQSCEEDVSMEGGQGTNHFKRKSSQSSNQSSKRRHSDVILLYQESFDIGRVLYALRSVQALLEAKPRLFTYSAYTTQMKSQASNSANYSALQEMLARHLHCMKGKSFYGDSATRSQTSMLVEVIIVTCLRYVRSWHRPRSLCTTLHDIRSVSCRILCSLVNQLTFLVCEKNQPSVNMTSSGVSSPQQLIAFVSSIFGRLNIQEVTLTALAYTVQALHASTEDALNIKNFTSDDIASFSDANIALWWSGSTPASSCSFQRHLLLLTRSLMVFRHRCAEIDLPSLRETTINTKQQQNTPHDDLRPPYLHDVPIAMQPLLLNCIVRVLRLQTARESHPDWLDFVATSLPFLSRALLGILTPVTSQICRNLEVAANSYVATKKDVGQSESPTPTDYVTTMLACLRTLTHSTLLLTAAMSGSLTASIERSASIASTAAQQSNTGASLAFSTLGSFFNVFGSSNTLRTQASLDPSDLGDDAAEAKRVTLGNLPRIVSCLSLVWNKIVKRSTDTLHLQTDSASPSGVHPQAYMGDNDSVAQSVLQLLSPIALQYGENLFSAMSIIWERRGRQSPNKQTQQTGKANPQQLQLVDLTCSVKSLHCDAVLGLVKQIIVQPPERPELGATKKHHATYEECLLVLTLQYVQRQPPTAVRDSRQAMLLLVRDCLAFGPPGILLTGEDSPAGRSAASPSGKKRLSVRCYFILLQLVVEYARVVHNYDDKRELKEMQEATIKCIEACNEIVDWSLEHGGWLARRAPTVLPASNHDVHVTDKVYSGSSVDLTDTAEDIPPKAVSSEPGFTSLPSTPQLNEEHHPVSMTVLPQKANPNYKHSVNALRVFAQFLANLLDLIFGSEEKEKMIPVLTSVVTNLTPYLRNHSVAFASSYLAAVSLLSSLSGYQQTRRAWKRDALDLFLEPGFFKMPLESVKGWRNIVDHLMTHDATTFKDLLVRIGLTRNAAAGTSLNIFSNKQQELEQRAMLLKRLAFVIFSSDVNQYQRHLPEIQERLSESLRLHLVPAVQAEVFTCFRVLLVRVSPKHLTSLWPSIVTELIQVLGQLEQELTLTDYEHQLDDSPAAKDRSAVPSNRVGILFTAPTSSSSVSYAHDKWLSLYLSACKLLDLALVLMPSQLQYFKLFRWSFVGEPGESPYDVPSAVVGDQKDSDKSNAVDTALPRLFVPHCIRIKRLLALKHPESKRYEVAPMRLLLNVRRITSLFELQPFFNTITAPGTMLKTVTGRKGLSIGSSGASLLSSSPIEEVISGDFVDDML